MNEKKNLMEAKCPVGSVAAGRKKEENGTNPLKRIEAFSLYNLNPTMNHFLSLNPLLD